MPKGYRRLYLFEEFDLYISSIYNIEVSEYVKIIDFEMSPEDVEKFIDLTFRCSFEEAKKILSSYIAT